MKNCNFLTAFYHQIRIKGTKTITIIFPIAQFVKIVQIRSKNAK